jgi:uncharacterized protein YegL
MMSINPWAVGIGLRGLRRMTGGQMGRLADQRAELFEVAPFALVVDHSESMDGVMNAVNSFVPELIETIEQTPEALESVALGVISFNEDAQLVRPLTWIDEDRTRPRFVAEGRTSYVKPLERARAMIDRETPMLGPRGFRPVIFFVTDARPNVETEAEWLTARTRLLSSPLRPKLVTFGFGNVDEVTLRKLASDPALAQFREEAGRAAMDEILGVVMNTVITLTNGTGRAPTGSLAQRILAMEGDDKDERTIAYRA